MASGMASTHGLHRNVAANSIDTLLAMSAVAYLETNVLYCDDNLHRLAQFPANCVDLIYLDAVLLQL